MRSYKVQFLLSVICACVVAFGGRLTHAQNMYANDTIEFGQARYSPNGNFRIAYGSVFITSLFHWAWTGSAWQANENLIFQSNYAHAPSVITVMQDDGNLVMYDYTGVRAETNTDGNSGAWLNIQDDGNLVIYNEAGTVALWAIY